MSAAPSTDYVYDLMTDRWRHPETDCVIDEEHMPAELVPDGWPHWRAMGPDPREARP